MSIILIHMIYLNFLSSRLFRRVLNPFRPPPPVIILCTRLVLYPLETISPQKWLHFPHTRCKDYQVEYILDLKSQVFSFKYTQQFYTFGDDDGMRRGCGSGKALPGSGSDLWKQKKIDLDPDPAFKNPDPTFKKKSDPDPNTRKKHGSLNSFNSFLSTI